MTAFLVLAEPRSGARREFTTSPVRIGRDPEFELVIEGEGAAVVSASHAILEHVGTTWFLSDLGSRNGTMLNDVRLAPDTRTPIATGAVIKFGDSGPQFRVVAVKKMVAATMVESAAPRPVAPPAPKPAVVASTTPAAPSPSAGEGPGMRTLGFQRQLHDERAKSTNRIRVVLLGAVALVVIGGGGAIVYSRMQTRVSQVALAAREAQVAVQERVNDSLRLIVTADEEQLRGRLATAEAAGGNTALVDSLTRALGAANQRSAELENSLQRAQRAVAQQQAAADSVRKASAAEIDRLKAELGRTGNAKSGLAVHTRDSLQKRLNVAQAQATEVAKLDAKVKAFGANLAQLAQVNGPAIGLVTAWFGAKAKSASGVVVSASGLMITSRAVMRDGDNEPDSIEVSLGGIKKSQLASELAVPDASGPEVGLIQIDDYTGAYVKKVDWKGASLKEGDAASVIGMPSGANAGTVSRPTVAAGVLGTLGGNQLGYDATTAVGAPGSALFNAAGELVAIHASKASKGYLAVPLKPARKLLTDDMRKELGI